MEVLRHQLILVAVLMTGRTDAVPERTRRNEEQLPLNVQVIASPVSTLNLNSEDQLSAEVGEGSIGKVITLQAPNGFSFHDSNESDESSETEANVLTEYDEEDEDNAAKIPGKIIILPPSRGFGYQNKAMVKNNAANQSKLQAQFKQEAQYGAESQANTVMQENQEVQFSDTSKNLPLTQKIMQNPHGTNPLLKPSVNNGDIKNTFKANPNHGAFGKLLNKPSQNPGSLYARLPNKVPSSNPSYAYGSPFVATTPRNDRVTYHPSIAYVGPGIKYTPFYQQNLHVSETGIEKNKPIANAYEVTRNPNWVPYQKGNPTKSLVATDIAYTKNNNWNPYTKPTEGESLVQAGEQIQSDAETEADLTAQEIGNRSPNLISYQKKNLNISLVPNDVFQNGYINNEHWNPYTKPAEGETLVQAEGNIQENDDRSLQLIQYQKENSNKPLVPMPLFQNDYNNNKNWNPYTKPAEGETLVQAEGNIQENDDRSLQLIQYQKENSNKPLVPMPLFQNGYNNNKNWNPYTKPAEGETLVQVEEEIQSYEKADTNIAAQENGNQSPNLLPYQKRNPNKSLVPTDVVSLNSYNNNKNWNPYTKPAEGETLIQAEGEILSNQLNSGMQYKSSTQDNILIAQSNNGFHYSEENKITNVADVAVEAPKNIASSYSGGLATTQMNKGMMYSGAQESESSIYEKTNQYNNGYLNGPGTANSHLQNGAQVGAMIGVKPPGQVGPVVETRFGQTTHPVYRPIAALPAFGYKYPNGWNHG